MAKLLYSKLSNYAIQMEEIAKKRTKDEVTNPRLKLQQWSVVYWSVLG